MLDNDYNLRPQEKQNAANVVKKYLATAKISKPTYLIPTCDSFHISAKIIV